MGQIDFLYKTLNNLFLGISQLVENIPMGGQYHVDLAAEYLSERVFNDHSEDFTPASDQAIDFCRAWIELMGKQGFLDKDDYEFHNVGDSIKIKVNTQNCSYYYYCTRARNENLIVTCPRMISCRWIASRFTGNQYQLIIEDIFRNDFCYGNIYPGEIMNEILSKDGDKLNIAGERAIVLSTNAFGILIKTMYDYAPHLLQQVLYESTYTSSCLEYDKLKKYFDDNRKIIDYLLNTVNRLGNIRYEIIEFDDLNKNAVIRGYGSYMAEIFKKNKLYTSPKATCASAKGRLAAYFTKAWEDEIVCEEVKCEAFGDDYCEFILLPKHL
jgi:hypothetical protein